MEQQYTSYRGHSNSSRRPHKLRVKRYNGPSIVDDSSNDAGTPPSKRSAAHEPVIASTSYSTPSSRGMRIRGGSLGGGGGGNIFLSSPDSPNNSSSSSRRASRTSSRKLMTPSSRIKHYNEQFLSVNNSLNNSLSPVPAAQVISGASSDASSSGEEIVTMQLNDAIGGGGGDGSFRSETGVELPPDNEIVSGVDDSIEDGDYVKPLNDEGNENEDTEYEHVFIDEEEGYADVSESSNRVEGGDVRTGERTNRYVEHVGIGWSKNNPRKPSLSPEGEYAFNQSTQEPLENSNTRASPAWVEDTHHTEGEDAPPTPEQWSPKKHLELAVEEDTAGESDSPINSSNEMDPPGTSQMATLATMAAAKRRSKMEEEDERLEPVQPSSVLGGAPMAEKSESVGRRKVENELEKAETSSVSAARRKKREMEKRRQAAGALASAAMLEMEKKRRIAAEKAEMSESQRDDQERTVTPQGSSNEIPAIQSTINSRTIPTSINRSMELKERNRVMEAMVLNSSNSVSRVRVPEKTVQPNIDVYSGQVIQASPGSDLVHGTDLRSVGGSMEVAAHATASRTWSMNSSNSLSRVRLPEKAVQPNIDVYSGHIIQPDPDNDGPVPVHDVENTLQRQLPPPPPLHSTQQQLPRNSSGSITKLRVPEKNYPPNIDLYTGLEISDEMSEAEVVSSEKKIPGGEDNYDDESTDEHSSASSDISALIKIPIRRCCWCCLITLLLAAAAYILVHFLLLDDGEESLEPSVSPDVEQPTLPPQSSPKPTDSTIVAPVEPPPTFQITPTAEPETLHPQSMPPVAAPTLPAMDMLRDFLVEEFPSLEVTFQDTTSPQYSALQWLSGNSFIGSYSSDRLKQRFALATFYYSTAGDQWINNEFWLTDRNECQWYTASTSRTPCDNFGSYVNLELNLNNLSGTIPSELSFLSDSLSRIDLTQAGSGPFITGSLPTHLGMLSQLEFLSLKGNSMTSGLPTDIGGWQNLVRLDLSVNNLSGTIPTELGLVTRLDELFLNDNSMSGTLISEFGRLTELRTVDISSNGLVGPIPSEIGRLTMLQDLNLNFNSFTLLPSTIGNLQHLRTFFASANDLTWIIPTEFGLMSSLLSVDLSQNSLVGPIPSEIGNLGVIQNILDFSDNQLSGFIPSELGRMLFLRNLSLHTNLLNGQVPASLSALGRLNTLRLEGNDLTGTVPTSVCAVFNNSYPVFVADCLGELVCPCCLFCCEDGANCECQHENTNLSFLCSSGFDK